MNLTDYGWNTVQAITQKQPNEIKFLIDTLEYPRLDRDSFGYVIRACQPARPRENLLSLHGMFFDDDASGRTSLWRMFRASLYHLCLHARYTDYSFYGEDADDSQVSNSIFAISLVEDYVIRGFMRASWPGLVLDTAYANQLCALRIREMTEYEDIATRLATNLLSSYMIGKSVAPLSIPISNQLRGICEGLKSLDDLAFRFAKSRSDKSISDYEELSVELVRGRRHATRRVLSLFAKHSAVLLKVPSIPYTDNYGISSIFESMIVNSELNQQTDFLELALKELSTRISTKRLEEESAATMTESQNILTDWGYSLERKQDLLEIFKQIDTHSHFQEYVFPLDDYGEFVRTRSRLIGPIRLILDQLRMIKTANDEVKGKESGYVDIPLAIQVLAAKSQRNDVFVQDELDNRSEAWTILVDSSKSLENIQGRVRDVTICLTEVAKELIQNSYSWACYAFNEKLYVVKDFAELYGNECRGRIGGLPTGIRTFLPDALRLAAKRLANCTEEIKVILLASDGYPLGYDGIDEELLEVIDQVSKSGINLIGLGVGSSLIQKYFRTNCIINSPSDLMKNFVKIYMEFASTI